MLTTVPFQGFYNTMFGADRTGKLDDLTGEDTRGNDAIATKPEPIDLVQFVGDFFQMPRSKS